MKFNYSEMLAKIKNERVYDMIVIEGVVGVGKSSLMYILGEKAYRV